MTVRRLGKNNINDLRKLLRLDLPEDLLKEACNGGLPLSPQAQMYGIYEGDDLVSAALATYSYTMPTQSNEAGRIASISGAYTLPEYRQKGYMTAICELIERDAKAHFKAAYVSVEATGNCIGFCLNRQYQCRNVSEHLTKKL